MMMDRHSLLLNKWLAVFFVCVLQVVCLLPGCARAAPLQFDIADDYVEITTGFTGTTLSIIGHRSGRGDIVIILEGPARSTVVRRKSQVLGAWINRDFIQFDSLPSYYDFASSVDDEAKLMNEKLLGEYHVGLQALKSDPFGGGYDPETVKIFRQALLDYKKAHRLYPERAGKIEFLSKDFFRVDFDLPAHVPAGDYVVRALLIDRGKVVHEDVQSLRVGLTGFSSDIYEFSRNDGLLYGIMCVCIACFMGWLSNVIVRRN